MPKDKTKRTYTSNGADISPHVFINTKGVTVTVDLETYKLAILSDIIQEPTNIFAKEISKKYRATIYGYLVDEEGNTVETGKRTSIQFNA